MDFTKIHNPYDFGNPVSDKDLFVGRKEELEEIIYYLDHAKTAPRPINIAIIGPRASGKTSLLNMCEQEAKSRNFCTVRIDLDEDDAKSQIIFFYKLFDSILTAACEKDIFGGMHGKTYMTYRETVDTYIIPEDKLFCSFQFPLQYAKAMGSGNLQVQLSDHNFKNDLLTIRSQLKCPIVILFDEGNVLSRSRVHLQKLRNIFMNTSGFMLVLTGTYDLFPIIDDVFSPIIRQFKKILIGGFKREEDTEDCIKKPLEKIGVKPSDIFDFETFRDVSEIHNLSGGRPYEIQLICHKLFKRLQAKRAGKMKLDLNILEEVRKELETSQDISTRHSLSKIRSLSKEQLLRLSALCVCDGQATFEQIWAIEYIFRAESRWKKQDLMNEMENFVKEGLICIKDGMIKFNGDDFDKIYTKYFAREQEARVSFLDIPLEVLWRRRLFQFLNETDGIDPIGPVSNKDIDINKIVNKLADSSVGEDVFVESPQIVEDLYFLMIKRRDEKTLPIIQVSAKFPWMSACQLFLSKNHYSDNEIKNYLSKTEDFIKYAKELDVDLQFEVKPITVLPIKTLIEGVSHTANEMMKNMIFIRHHTILLDEYLKRAKLEEALFHANLLFYEYKHDDPPFLNNLGYLKLRAGDFDVAKDLIERAISQYKTKSERALPNYNLGILYAQIGNMEMALKHLRLSVAQLKNVKREKRGVACIIAPKKVGGAILFEETKNVDLMQEAKEAIKKLY